MKIVSLDPNLTDILYVIGAGRKLVGVSHLCAVSSEKFAPSIVTAPCQPTSTGDADRDRLQAGLSNFALDLEAIRSLDPSVIVCNCRSEDPQAFHAWAEGYFSLHFKLRARVSSINILTFDGIFSAYKELGRLTGMAREGADIAQRNKSQLLDWGRNFYERLRNKKVTVLSSVEPLEVAGLWIPDIIKVVSGRPQPFKIDHPSTPTTWEEIAAFAPDVILIAPRGCTLNQSVKFLPTLEQVPDWEAIPAVRRGEVVFAGGHDLYNVGSSFVAGMAVLVSAMAGLDSGYITKKDEFYRLRFVELQRHRFM